MTDRPKCELCGKFYPARPLTAPERREMISRENRDRAALVAREFVPHSGAIRELIDRSR